VAAGGGGASELTGGLDEELDTGADCDDAPVADEPSPPPHAASATVATNNANQRLPTPTLVICVMNAPQSIAKAIAEAC
jgi:hypothetical protein